MQISGKMNNTELNIVSEEFDTINGIAMRLLMDDINANFIGSLILTNSKNNNDNKNAFLFETLLLICMEMIFILGKMVHGSDPNDDFEPDMENFNINDFYTILKNKFEKINIFLNIEKYEFDVVDQEILQNIVDNRYCRILLKHSDEDKNLFRMCNVENNAYYHCVLNGKYTIASPKLYEMYSIINLNGAIWQITFNQ